MFTELFNLNDVLMVPIIMVCTAAGAAVIVVALKYLIKGAVSLGRAVLNRFKKT